MKNINTLLETEYVDRKNSLSEKYKLNWTDILKNGVLFSELILNYNLDAQKAVDLLRELCKREETLCMMRK